MGDPVDLQTPLRLRNSFAFPLQTADGRREVLWGAVLLVALPGVGWLLNMGHRIAFVRRMQRGLPPFPAFSDPTRSWHAVYRELLWDGFVTFLGMAYYHAPGAVLLGAGALLRSAPLLAAGATVWLAATALVPGYMTHYCAHRNAREILNPLVALRRVRDGGRAYWHAWSIVLVALTLSFVGLLAFGVGFFVTSVWFWQVAGFSFATVFSQRLALVGDQ
ncbi:hypothetical protein [Mycobacterium sp.]|uniref:hypothetical protein n=1 Tax=Mycobacterium sp. TaxID=1785 RepID=UPI002B7C96E2|nr:hypothetical protein [Mycobacterium sp.]HTQ16598.1 hypothetical protein [Mycobacterium sp.]